MPRPRQSAFDVVYPGKLRECRGFLTLILQGSPQGKAFLKAGPGFFGAPLPQVNLSQFAEAGSFPTFISKFPAVRQVRIYAGRVDDWLRGC